MDARELSRSRLAASRAGHYENLVSQAKEEDSNRVFYGQFVSVNSQTREVQVRLLSGQVVNFGLDFLGANIASGDSVQITFARGASRAIVVSKQS
jgi:hypothetical protein